MGNGGGPNLSFATLRPEASLISALICSVLRLGRESLGLGLDHWAILVGFAHSCCKVPWLLRERQQCGEPEPLMASFLVVLAYCLVLGHKG